jgi:hypothetical protein
MRNKFTLLDKRIFRGGPNSFSEAGIPATSSKWSMLISHSRGSQGGQNLLMPFIEADVIRCPSLLMVSRNSKKVSV